MFRSNVTNSSGAFRWKKPPSVRVDGNWCSEHDKDIDFHSKYIMMLLESCILYKQGGNCIFTVDCSLAWSDHVAAVIDLSLIKIIWLVTLYYPASYTIAYSIDIYHLIHTSESCSLTDSLISQWFILLISFRMVHLLRKFPEWSK